MAEHFSQAWILLGVGMLTVFGVLWLVVLIGNGIILLVDRFLPESESKSKGSSPRSDISRAKIAAIVTAVQAISGGRGQVVKIERK